MRFSFSTLYMAIVSSNVLLILLTLCFYNKKIMVNAGYRLLSLFVSFTLIRFLLPVELPFTKTLSLPEWISSILAWVRHTLFNIAGYKISLWTILQAIWFIGFIVKLIQYIRIQSKARYAILSHSLDATAKEPYKQVLDRICAAKNKKNVFRVLTVSGLRIPLLYGMFKPCILLPEDLNLSEDDLYYVLAHEASHHFHHDLLIKALIRFIDMAYWWNPFCHILVRQTDIISEMRIDNNITLSDSHTIQGYLRCLLQLAEHATNESTVSAAVTIPLLASNDGEMTKRFEMLAASSEHKRYSVNLFLLLSVLCTYLLSYAFIFEAYYATPEVEESSMAPVTIEFYAILREDNTYDIYYGSLLIENTDSLKYHQGIQVYTEKEYNHETH